MLFSKKISCFAKYFNTFITVSLHIPTFNFSKYCFSIYLNCTWSSFIVFVLNSSTKKKLVPINLAFLATNLLFTFSGISFFGNRGRLGSLQPPPGKNAVCLQSLKSLPWYPWWFWLDRLGVKRQVNRWTLQPPVPVRVLRRIFIAQWWSTANNWFAIKIIPVVVHYSI